MKWQKKQKLNRNSNCKIVKRFALFPIEINNEYRWLETCYIVKRRWISWHESGWQNISWTDKNTYLIWKKGCFPCHISACKHHLDGGFCALQYDAKIDNNGVCYSIEVNDGSKEHNS